MKLYRIRENNVSGMFTTPSKGSEPLMMGNEDAELHTASEIAETLMEALEPVNAYCSCCGERWNARNLQVMNLDAVEPKWEYCNLGI